MVIDISPKFYSALSSSYDLEVKVTGLEIFRPHYDLDFKVIVLFFYLIDKHEVNKLSCLVTDLVSILGKNFHR